MLETTFEWDGADIPVSNAGSQPVTEGELSALGKILDAMKGQGYPTHTVAAALFGLPKGTGQESDFRIDVLSLIEELDFSKVDSFMGGRKEGEPALAIKHVEASLRVPGTEQKRTIGGDVFFHAYPRSKKPCNKQRYLYGEFKKEMESARPEEAVTYSNVAEASKACDAAFAAGVTPACKNCSNADSCTHDFKSEVDGDICEEYRFSV